MTVNLSLHIHYECKWALSAIIIISVTLVLERTRRGIGGLGSPAARSVGPCAMMPHPLVTPLMAWV